MAKYETVNSYTIVAEPKVITADVKIDSAISMYEYARKLYPDNEIGVREVAYLILLNQGNIITGYYTLGVGGISKVVVDCKLACKVALDALATSCIFVHNHPSGNKLHSDADLDVTFKLKTALNTIGVKLLDSLIIVDDGYTSFIEEDLI